MANKMKFSDLFVDMTDEEYYKEDSNDVVFSYSLVSKYQREGCKGLDKLFEPTPKTEALTFGSLVDYMLTTNIDGIPDDMVISDNIKVDAKIDGIVSAMLSKEISITDDAAILPILDDYSYWAKYKESTRLTHFHQDADAYYEMRKSVGNKTIISNETYQEAQRLVREAMEGELTGSILRMPDEWEKGIEKFYQPKFRCEIECDTITMKWKAMMDLVIVNHNEKKIQIVDIKTSASACYDFPESYWKWNYHYQAQAYEEIMKKVIEGTDFKDYEVEPLIFLVMSKTYGKPMVWRRCPDYTDYTRNYLTSGVKSHYPRPAEQDVFTLATEIVKCLYDVYHYGWAVPMGIKTDEVNQIW